MGRTYDTRPNVSSEPYLTGEGQDNAQTVMKHLDTAIEELEGAISELGRIEGMGTELYIERLRKLIRNYQTVKTAIRALRIK